MVETFLIWVCTRFLILKKSTKKTIITLNFYVPLAFLASVGKGRIGEFGPKTAASEGEERNPSRFSHARKSLSPPF